MTVETLVTLVPEIHLAATLFMAGLIVFVQIVHYPLMARVGEDGFQEYEAGHTRRTAWVVIPPMVAELGTSVWLFAEPISSGDQGWATLGLILVGAIWVSTALLQAPAHGQLSRGWSAGTHRFLVNTNWIRTVAWLVRVPVAFALLS